MACQNCGTVNDTDARYCGECGKNLSTSGTNDWTRTRKAYLFMLLLVPVIAVAGGIGYYKYYLPTGVVAVVNGEEIGRSELDARLTRMQSTAVRETSEDEPAAVEARRVRYAALNGLITEKILLQEARKAGVGVSREEVTASLEQARASSGMDREGFIVSVNKQYGSWGSFESAIERELIIKRFLNEKVVSQGLDARQAAEAMNAWLRDLSARAQVRITLAEQWSGAGCGCGDSGVKTQAPRPAAASQGCAMMKTGSPGMNEGCRRMNSGAPVPAAKREQNGTLDTVKSSMKPEVSMQPQRAQR